MTEKQLARSLEDIFHAILGFVQNEQHLPDLRVESIEDPWFAAFEGSQRILWTYECVGIGTKYVAIVKYMVSSETDSAVLAKGTLCCVEA